jgi:hypothetical protein
MIGGAETRDMGDPIVALHLVLGVRFWIIVTATTFWFLWLTNNWFAACTQVHRSTIGPARSQAHAATDPSLSSL